ncbi:MAG: hypothetical protein ACXWZW_03390 [Solirubrobacterales bacterium]
MSEPLVCGFWGDRDGPVGLAWRLGGAEGAIAGRAVGPSGQTDSVAVGGGIGESEGELTIEFEREVESAGPAEARLSAGVATPLETASGGPARGGARAAVGEARATSEGNGKVRPARGLALRWDEDPTAGSGLFRALFLPAPDGEALLLTAVREPRASNHADEAVSAWLLDRDGRATAFEEALLSTQYDGDGLQTRVGLELWPADADAPLLRAAATTFGLSRSHGVSAALMASSVEGAEGTGGYLIWRS